MPTMRTRMRRLNEVVEEELARGALPPVDRVGARGTPQALRHFRYIMLFPFSLLQLMGSGWVSVRVFRLALLVRRRGAEVGLRRCLRRWRPYLRLAPWLPQDQIGRRSWRTLWTRTLWGRPSLRENAVFLLCTLRRPMVSLLRSTLHKRRMDCLTWVQPMVPVGGRPP